MNPFLIALVAFVGVIGYAACGTIVTGVVAAKSVTVEETKRTYGSSYRPLPDTEPTVYKTQVNPFVAALIFLGWPLVVVALLVFGAVYGIGRYVLIVPLGRALIVPLGRALNKAIKAVAHRLNPHFHGWADFF